MQFPGKKRRPAHQNPKKTGHLCIKIKRKDENIWRARHEALEAESEKAKTFRTARYLLLKLSG